MKLWIWEVWGWRRGTLCVRFGFVVAYTPFYMFCVPGSRWTVSRGGGERNHGIPCYYSSYCSNSPGLQVPRSSFKFLFVNCVELTIISSNIVNVMGGSCVVPAQFPRYVRSNSERCFDNLIIIVSYVGHPIGFSFFPDSHLATNGIGNHQRASRLHEV